MRPERDANRLGEHGCATGAPLLGPGGERLDRAAWRGKPRRLARSARRFGGAQRGPALRDLVQHGRQRGVVQPGQAVFAHHGPVTVMLGEPVAHADPLPLRLLDVNQALVGRLLENLLPRLALQAILLNLDCLQVLLLRGTKGVHKAADLVPEVGLTRQRRRVLAKVLHRLRKRGLGLRVYVLQLRLLLVDGVADIGHDIVVRVHQELEPNGAGALLAALCDIE
mmetsp:Transcript_6949/g.17963  ORF Transcript_6949/g.17963 Transcript_6949/m.17963 type:complete len:224 (-) Transcript_6949:1088-1759(-)